MNHPEVSFNEAKEGLPLLTPRQLAWEFLRRNKNYQRDFIEGKLLRPSEADSRARRWRLQIFS